MGKSVAFKDTPYGKIFDEYLEWMTENAAGNTITDYNFLLFLMSRENIQDYLIKQETDVNGLDLWVQANIKREQRHHEDFFKEDISFESAIPINGFFGKVYKDFEDSADAFTLLDETIMAMESAYQSSKKGSKIYHIFGLDPDSLQTLRTFGLTYEKLCSGLPFSSRNKTYNK